MTLTPTDCDNSGSEPNPQPALRLSLAQARVLATLMEKARTVPDSYPLSLNALTLGCNQKTTREPVMNLSEPDVAAAIDTLKERNLVRQAGGGRVARFEHNFQRGLQVPEQSAVLLGVLMLRGPQTAAELRLNSERWYKFADVSSVEGFLEEMQARAAEKGGPLVVKLAKAPGAREQRWTHLLCGPVDVASLRSSDKCSGDTGERIERLEAEVAALRETVQRLCAELGIDQPRQFLAE